jgi:signal transduction histidine kinase/DNA-binding response OmpR family regulator
MLYYEREGGGREVGNPFRFRLTSRREATVVEYRRKNGEMFLGETTSSAVMDGDGQTVGFLSIVRDISEEVRLREAQILVERDLQKSEQLLRESGKLARVGGWELDVGTWRMTWSDEIYRILELEPGPEPTLDLALSFFEPEARAKMRRASKQAIEEGLPYDLEVPLTTAKRQQLWVRAIGQPQVAGDETVRLTGVLQDVTRSKQAEQAKREFISVVSHELRTPLTSIRGALGLLDGGLGGDLSEKARELVSIASKNSARLGELINDILDIEKIEAGRISLNIVSVELEAKVREVVRANQAYAEGLGVAVSVTSEADRALIRADASRFEQVITNLLSNAIKFSPSGESVEVRVCESPREEFWRVSVSDVGPGIPEDFEARVFEKFAQADSSDTRRVTGTGLGLSITKALTERMGGYIGYRTQAGEGTTFFVDFPGDFSTASDAVGPQSRTLLGRILICEDDPDIARILRLSLAHEAEHIDVANSAEQALEMLREREYAAMTVDLHLTGRGGLALIHEIGMNPDWSDLAVVVVSATAEEGKREAQGLSFGVVDWIQKPIDHDRLKRALRYGAKHVEERTRPTVLHVEDDSDVVEVTRHLIEDVADTVSASSREETCRLIRESDFDLVILDVLLPDGSGLDLLDELAEASKSRIPVVVFSVFPESGDLVGEVAAQLVSSRPETRQFREATSHLADADGGRKAETAEK